ncbi:hypothetical protein HPB48_023004 [Haemaphysalis longicornis]|uniref:Reverse transcriptase domain-containing protein n=1 Tax=Haemaphysalis longicornis TaxID=44386 RepID=A0A9J6FNB8_HAELO|nr:hypothetical protein HPB48_023004 [Haemaphysalis longicornis]
MAASVRKTEGNTLSVFSANTHKDECPFRVIVSERGTWQRHFSTFLQKSLSSIEVDDPCLVRKPHVVDEFLLTPRPKNVRGFSEDVMDLFYSLQQKLVCEEVSACIDRYGAVRFQNACVLSADSFMELLPYYFTATLISHQGNMFIEKEGICIGSSLALILSDMLLARYDRSLMAALKPTNTTKVYRYVDDYLVLYQLTDEHQEKFR